MPSFIVRVLKGWIQTVKLCIKYSQDRLLFLLSLHSWDQRKISAPSISYPWGKKTINTRNLYTPPFRPSAFCLLLSSYQVIGNCLSSLSQCLISSWQSIDKEHQANRKRLVEMVVSSENRLHSACIFYLLLSHSVIVKTPLLFNSMLWSLWYRVATSQKCPQTLTFTWGQNPLPQHNLLRL